MKKMIKEKKLKDVGGGMTSCVPCAICGTNLPLMPVSNEDGFLSCVPEGIEWGDGLICFSCFRKTFPEPL